MEQVLVVWDILMGFLLGFGYLFGLGVVEWLADWRLGYSSVVAWMGRMVLLAGVGCWFPLIVKWQWLLDGLYGVGYHSDGSPTGWFDGLAWLSVAVDGANRRRTSWGGVGMKKVIDGLVWQKDMVSSFYYSV
jgi:hypothetical protein